MVFYQNVWYLRVLIKYIMHKTHPSSKKLKDFFKSSIKNESRLYFDCAVGPLSSSLFVVVPHQVTQTSCWLVKKCVARYLQKRKTIFRTSILGCKYTENVSADGGIFWKNGGNHEFYVFLKLVHHNFPSFPIFCQIDKTC